LNGKKEEYKKNKDIKIIDIINELKSFEILKEKDTSKSIKTIKIKNMIRNVHTTKNSSLSETDTYEWTLLHIACYKGSMEIVFLLFL